MKATTESAYSATMPMQVRCRRDLVKSSSDQGNSNASRSIASTSGMSRRIIQRTWIPAPSEVSADSDGLVTILFSMVPVTSRPMP